MKPFCLFLAILLASCAGKLTPSPNPEQMITSAPARAEVAPAARDVRESVTASGQAATQVERRAADLQRQVADAKGKIARADSEIRRLVAQGQANQAELVELGTQVEELLAVNDTLEADFSGMQGEMMKWRAAHDIAVVRANELFESTLRKDEEVADLRRERDDLRAQVARLEAANKANALAAQKGQVDGAGAKGEAKSWKTLGYAILTGVFLLALVVVLIKVGLKR